MKNLWHSPRGDFNLLTGLEVFSPDGPFIVAVLVSRYYLHNMITGQVKPDLPTRSASLSYDAQSITCSSLYRRAQHLVQPELKALRCLLMTLYNYHILVQRVQYVNVSIHRLCSL
jgi:hypothetical protein